MSEPIPSHAAADRNLLYGILALQMDFISRDALIRAMNAWVLDKAKPLGQILQERGALRPDAHALLDALVEKHLELHGHDAEKSLASVSSIGSIREQLEQIADPDVQGSLVHVSVARPDGDGAGVTRVTDASTPAPASSRFRILRPHAKGGLGAVFVALDEDLHREVALKEIQVEHAGDPGSRERFLREAEITGRLEHPGVVPVYGLGHYADGRPFYAMRFIKGDSLKDAIAKFHRNERPGRDPGERALALRRLLGRFVDICNAIAYAHSRGVLHRDLKPGNVMLGPYGETLVVDWGLAKPVGRAPESLGETGEGTLRPLAGSGETVTVAGSALGTPEYMSPEQAAGDMDKLGPASDVYSLGATLYALLTGQAPFRDKDTAVILERVRKGDFAAPRQVNDRVPAALDAICLKAMALRPDDRYASPRALADDLEQWLADEPVSVLREPLLTRLARWGRRHKAFVSGAAALLLTAVVLLSIGIVAVTVERQRTEQARLNEATERRRAEENEQKALAAAEAEKRAKSDAEAREAETNAVLDFVENKIFAAASLGRYADALKLNEETLALLKAKLGPDHPKTLRSMGNLAITYAVLGRHADALKLNGETLALRKAKLGPDHPDTLESQNKLANNYAALGQHADALKLNEETLALQKAELGPDHPDTLESMKGLAKSLLTLDRGPEALSVIDECLKRAAGKVVDPRLIPRLMELRLRHFEKTKDAAGCRATAEMWDQLKRTDAGSLYDAACMRAVTAGVFANTVGADATRLAKEQADLAMAWLRKAVAAGYTNAAHMKKDPDLDPLRQRDDFKQLLAELEKGLPPAKPPVEPKSK